MKVKLTSEQVDFINNAPLDAVLTACPGSGKTVTAVLRFIERCRAGNDYGVAFLSYTNVAVEEALECARENNASGLVAYPNLVATLDSFFRRFVFEPFIRTALPDIPENVDVFESRPPAAIATDSAFNIFGIRADRRFRSKSVASPVKVWDLRAYVDDSGMGHFECKKDDYSDDWIQAAAHLNKPIWEAKTKQLTRGYATYNDVLLFCWALLGKPERRIAEILASRFGEIIVDEAQDTSGLQQSSLARLARKGTHISYVGDKRQGIYLFNRANPEYLEELLRNGHKEFMLTTNFRSNENIVSVVNHHFGTEMVSAKTKEHQLQGAYLVVGSEADAIDRFSAFIRECKCDASDGAVLVRERGHLSHTLKDYATKGWRSGPRLALEAWQSERRQDLRRALRAASRLIRSVVDDDSLQALGEGRLQEVGWLFLRGERFPDPRAEESPRAWAVRLREGLKLFLEANRLSKNAAFEYRMATNGTSTAGSALNDFSFQPPAVRTTVIHQVKGESISAVLVIAPTKQHKKWLDQESDEEELNVCYVAFTRAADILVLHCPSEAEATEWRKRGFLDLLETQ